MQFIDLKAQQDRIKDKIDSRIQAVLEHGKYIMGPEIGELENNLSEFCGAKHALTCSSGTDALALILMAWNVKPNDAVFVPTFTFIATAEVVAWLGATPYFVDVDAQSFNMDPESLKRAIAQAKKDGLNPKAVIAVDLFGQPADYDALSPIAKENGMMMLADSAQSFGGSLNGKNVGTFGDATATSFFPAKPLGCYGDGGAIFTDNDELSDIIKSLRIHGKGTDKYDNVRIGMNGRMDTMQAAILLEKLAIFKDELAARDKVATQYNERLNDCVQVPELASGASSSWAQYTLVTNDRATLQNACKEAGIPTAIYYPKPLHQQTGYKHYPADPNGLGVSEDLSQKVISLPMHPYMDEKTQDTIINTIQQTLMKEAA